MTKSPAQRNQSSIDPNTRSPDPGRAEHAPLQAAADDELQDNSASDSDDNGGGASGTLGNGSAG